MDLQERRNKLVMLGAVDCDMEALLEYTANSFSPRENIDNDEFLSNWEPTLQIAETIGAAEAINRTLVADELKIDFTSPESVRVELFNSAAGIIPIITAKHTSDYESMVRNIIFKGREVPNISEMGASFAFGKSNRFIILSCKPYSNVTAERMGMDEAEWRDSSLIIRKYHECAHYYTKRFWGSSRNNLHDELIADFAGLYAAFGEYRAQWFLRFLGLSEDSDGYTGRFKVYAAELSETAAKIIRKLAVLAANGVESWSKSPEFSQMDSAAQIDALCTKDLLMYVV